MDTVESVALADGTPLVEIVSGSSSSMLSVTAGAASVPLSALVNAMTTVSVGSAIASGSTDTVNVVLVAPGRMVATAGRRGDRHRLWPCRPPLPTGTTPVAGWRGRSLP
ncbi:MAG: hypothetical protein IPP16_00015 [Acidimicrobiaceae bacterium]|nr:hypothetical protein [Acidimicrobiaceae bacterium]